MRMSPDSQAGNLIRSRLQVLGRGPSYLHFCELLRFVPASTHHVVPILDLFPRPGPAIV